MPRGPIGVRTEYGDGMFADFASALVFSALPFMCKRGEQWTKEMGRPQTDLGFMIVHESAVDAIHWLRAHGQDPTDHTEIPNSYIVMTGTREEIELYCARFGCSVLAPDLKLQLGGVPVVTIYEELAIVKWIHPTSDEHLS